MSVFFWVLLKFIIMIIVIRCQASIGVQKPCWCFLCGMALLVQRFFFREEEEEHSPSVEEGAGLRVATLETEI